MRDDIASFLFQCNLGLRVVDAEDIGVSYRNDVKRELDLFDMQNHACLVHMPSLKP